MLKSFPILRKKGAHFIRKKRQLKKIIVDFRGLNV
jgi:hypothetical protein